jgi:hypothetical protein
MEAAATTSNIDKNIPKWSISGDWFDVCRCDIPCPCIFAKSPTNGVCEGILAYHIKYGNYGGTQLDGLNVLAISYFKGNIWAGETKADFAIYFDETANEEQRNSLNMIFSGKAGGFMAEFAQVIGEVRAVSYAPIKIEVSEDLDNWNAEIPGKVIARAEALSGPMTPPGKRVQTINAPGSEVGPGTVATWGKSIADEVNAPDVRFEWKRSGKSSKHIPFDWSGP